MMTTLILRLVALSWFASQLVHAGHFLRPSGMDGRSYISGTTMNITWDAEYRLCSLFLQVDDRRVLLTTSASRTWFEWHVTTYGSSSAGPYALQILSLDSAKDDKGRIASAHFSSASFNIIPSRATAGGRLAMTDPGQLRLPSRPSYPRALRTNATISSTSPTPSTASLGTLIPLPPTSTSTSTSSTVSALSANNSREDSNNPLHASRYIYYAIGIGIGASLLILIAATIGLVYWLRARKRAQQTRHLQVSLSDNADGKEAPGAVLSQWWMTNKLGSYQGPYVQRRHYGTGDFEHWMPQRVMGASWQMKEDWGAGVNEKLLAVQRKMGGGWERLNGEGDDKWDRR